MGKPRKTVLPQHMKKTIERVEEIASAVDIVFEVVDARAPEASRCHIMTRILAGSRLVTVLSKTDLADADATKEWKDSFDAREIPWVELPYGKKLNLDKFMGRSILPEVHIQEGAMLKALIIGVPNVGKSTLINLLTGKHRAPTGAKPGITRGVQLVKVMPGMFVYDTPGVINPTIKSETHAHILGLIGCLQESFYDAEAAAYFLAGRILATSRAAILEAHYDMRIDPDLGAGGVMEALAARRGFLLKGGAPDCIRACKTLAADFSTGRIKGVSLERPAARPELQN